MKKDVLTALREYEQNGYAAGAGVVGVPIMLLTEALAEIERLRSLAGAVSQGDGDLAAIKRGLTGVKPRESHVDDVVGDAG